ncbi:MAG: M20/M25/M40 family metallo-hydrolase, partial [Chloroflexota bacterium]
MTTPREYAQEHAEVFNQQLYELIRIPSVSTEPERKADVRRAAEWVASEMRRVGAQNVEVMETAGHPVVYGDWLGAGADAPTVLIYGHYDVQPASMSDGWTSEPFEPVVRNGLVYARGASDDKGQMFIHIKVLESFLATEGKAPVNLKFMFEGEEEIGSLNLGKFIQANKERFSADICVISDGGIQDEHTPSICYAVRGMTYMQLDVWGPSQDLHSGGYGGMVHNPALALAQIISKLHDANNHIAVPGFYDDVVLLKDDERAELAKLDMTESKL